MINFEMANALNKVGQMVFASQLIFFRNLLAGELTAGYGSKCLTVLKNKKLFSYSELNMTSTFKLASFTMIELFGWRLEILDFVVSATL